MASAPDVPAELTPGTRVELHSLSRVELNGCTGVCRELVHTSGRWAVLLDHPTKPVAGGLLVKPANLRRLPNRADAARALCALLAARHPTQGFLIHPALRFEELDGDVCVRADAAIEKGDILLVVPESAMVAVSSEECGRIPLDDGRRTMQDVLDAIEAAFDDKFAMGLPVLEGHNVTLAVLLMHVACQASDELYQHVAATWPSISATTALPVRWEQAQVDRLTGTPLADAVSSLQADIEEAFQRVVFPVLGEPPLAPSFTPQGHTLRDGFVHALALALSRSHGDNRMRSASSSVGKLAPLADLFNGVPEGHPDVNVALHRGKWPFVRGGRYTVGATDLLCTAVAATRDVAAGTELVYSYGEASTTGFVRKFGAVPLPLDWRNPNDEAEVLLSAEIVRGEGGAGGGGEGGGDELAQLRARALRLFGLDEEASLFLSEAELETPTDELEPEEGGLAAVRLAALLLVGSADLVRACGACAQRGVPVSGMAMELASGLAELMPPPATLGAKLVELIDRNLQRLPTSSSEIDLERCERLGSREASSALEVVAIRTRVKQRSLLAAWRSRFCREHGLSEG